VEGWEEGKHLISHGFEAVLKHFQKRTKPKNGESSIKDVMEFPVHGFLISLSTMLHPPKGPAESASRKNRPRTRGLLLALRLPRGAQHPLEPQGYGMDRR